MEHRDNRDFFKRILSGMDLELREIQAEDFPALIGHFGPADRLSPYTEAQVIFPFPVPEPKERIIYRVSDVFFCRWLLWISNGVVQFIGPYLTNLVARQSRLHLCQQYHIRHQGYLALDEYYETLPLLADEEALLTVVNAYGELLWPEGFVFSDLSIESGPVPLPEASSIYEEEIPPEKIQEIEQRYQSECDVLYYVSQGMVEKIDSITQFFDFSTLEQRNTDPIRNTKNYLIILNSILRKAAESARVHPYYLDRISSNYGKRIELIRHQREAVLLQKEIMHAYAMLVRRYGNHNHSSLVEDVLVCIHADVTQDLSLSALAARQHVNASYLSALFSKEMGQSLSTYVAKTRMEHASYLLERTGMSVQMVAQYCGFSDANYFSKQFRKLYGMNPTTYRNQHIS